VLAVTQLRALRVTVGCADEWACGSRKGSPLTVRTLEQNIALGLVASDDEAVPTALDEKNVQISDDKVFTPGNLFELCAHYPNSHEEGQHALYLIISIHQDILIMSTNCGYKDNEVKSGTAVSEKGQRITLRCEDREDLSWDILKVCLQKLISAITDHQKLTLCLHMALLAVDLQP